MARKARDERPGYHHVVTRGNNKQTIFLTDHDRLTFMELLGMLATKFNWDILAYCLMRNHYHLVLRVHDSLARGMRDLNGFYAVYFNAEHGRINHLFGKRYWNEFTETDEHLKNAIRYVIQNPRRAGAHGPLSSHPWTSYRPSIGETFGPARFARDDVLGLFGPSPAVALRAFVSFCDEPAPSRPRETPRNQVPAPKLRVRVT
jgi:REP element-mobilizing transposase RayT